VATTAQVFAHRSAGRSTLARTTVTYILMALLALVFLGPLLFMVVGALKPGELVLADSTSWRVLWPTGASLDNFFEAARRSSFGTLLRNSVIVSAAVVGGGLVVNSLMGYALARLHFRGRSVLLVTIISLVIVPFQAIAIPLLYVMSELSLRNTFLVQILPFLAQPLYIYLFYTFFLGLPREYEEAARIDGAGPMRIFCFIAAPLAKPAYAAVAVLTFLGVWNELLWPALVTDDIAVRPLPLALSLFRGDRPVDQGVIMAFVFMMVLPSLALFVVAQRSFVQGVASTGVKG